MSFAQSKGLLQATRVLSSRAKWHQRGICRWSCVFPGGTKKV